jgi:hypothetical protein
MNIEQILVMALGLFIGNFFFHTVFRKDWIAGLFIGLVSAILYIPLMYIFVRLNS